MTQDLWFGTSGPRDAKIALVGEAWGPSELSSQRPFSGGSGEELTRILADAGINRADCFLTNVCPTYPPVNRKGKHEFYMLFEETTAARKSGVPCIRGLYPSQRVRDSLNHLYHQLLSVRPDVIIALGNYALWALVDHPHLGVADEDGHKVPVGVTTWRGSQHLVWNTSPGISGPNPPPVIPTFNPAAILQNWEARASMVHDLRVRRGKTLPPLYNFIIRPSYETVIFILEALTEHLPSGSFLSRDYETAAGHADCLGIAWSATEAICIPFIDLATGQSIWSISEESSIREGLQALFGRKDLLWSGQNFNYELQYEAEWFDATTPAHFDTMIAHHLLFPGTPMDLTSLSALYCRYHRYWGEANWWESSGRIEARWVYNCEDAARTWELTQVLNGLVDSMGFRAQFEERMEISRANLDLMLRGIRIDGPERQRQAMSVFLGMEEFRSEFESILPGWVPALLRGKGGKPKPWFDSPTQQMRLFYDLCGIPEIIDPKRKTRTVDDDAMQKIALAEPLLADLCRSLLDYRSHGVYYNNFLTAALDRDGRLRCSIGEGPISFRMRSGKNAFGRGTNLQNIPKEKDE